MGDPARLIEFGWLYERLSSDDAAASLDAVMQDYAAAVETENQGSELHESLLIWQTFLAESKVRLRAADKSWPANRILLQLAMEHADDSPVTRSAGQWLETGACDYAWLRRRDRPKHRLVSPVLRRLHHQDNVRGALVLRNGWIVTWTGCCWATGKNRDIYVWNPVCGDCLAVLKGHKTLIQDVLAVGTRFLVSWDIDVILIWDLVRFTLLRRLAPGKNITLFRVALQGKGKVACWTRYTEDMWAWDVASGALEKEGRSTPPGEAKAKGISTKRLAKHCSRKHPRLDLQHWRSKRGALILKDGRVLTWSEHPDAIVWDPERFVGGPLSPEVGMGAMDTMLLPGERLACFSNHELRGIWDIRSAKLVHKHPDRLSGPLPPFVSAEGMITNCDSRTGARLSSLDRSKTEPIQLGDDLKLFGEVVETGDQGFLDEVWTELTVRGDIDQAAIKMDGCYRFGGAVWFGTKGLLMWENNRVYVWRFGGNPDYWYHSDEEERVLGALVLGEKTFVTWSTDRSLVLWDALKVRGITRFVGHRDWVCGACVTRDGRLLSWSRDGDMRLWSFDSGECIEEVRADQLASRRPEWLQERKTLDPLFQPRHGFEEVGFWGPAGKCAETWMNRVGIVPVRPRNGAAVVWVTEGRTRARHLLSDGTLIATTEDGTLVFLELYRGANRIGLATL